MHYKGKLYGKVGNRYIELAVDTDEVDKWKESHYNAKKAPIKDRSHRSPRSMDRWGMTGLEIKILDLMVKVEELGASEDLTNCIESLDDAKYFLSKHIDSRPD